MEIHEAIEHAKKVAKEKYIAGVLCHANPNDYELDACIECAKEHEQLAEWLQELQEYQQLGTLEEVRAAVEKQEAKKPTYDGDGYAPDGTFVWDEWICTNCGHRYEIDYEEHDYCPYCGQRIDWSVNDRKE